jgi:hypothetical protein
MADRALAVRKPAAITLQRDADIYRLGALVLSTLDRLDVPDQEFSRIVVYSQQVVVFELPWLTCEQADDLIEHHSFGQRLTQLIAPRLIGLQRRAQGCAIVIDLNSHSQ